VEDPVECHEVLTQAQWRQALEQVRADFRSDVGQAGRPRWVAYISYEAGRFCESSVGQANDGVAFDNLPKALFWRFGDSARVRTLPAETFKVPKARARAHPSAEEHAKRIERCRAHIGAGDIYQANLSRRIELDFEHDLSAFDLTRSLQAREQHSYAAWLNLGYGFEIVSLTPECLLKGSFGRTRVSSFPIKGTAEPGSKELCVDPKEQAEHTMIVDLVRNDLGRVSLPGRVWVDPLIGARDMRTLRHLESAVHGELREGYDVLDALEALLPGGSITGAPKIRSTEIIAEIEMCQRGPYTGALMTIDAAGNVVVSLLIRTLVKHGSQAWLDVGGGIVWDSNPAREVEETRRKALAHLEGIVEQIP
jgi:para-aminobenzoate synthetase component 1